MVSEVVISELRTWAEADPPGYRQVAASVIAVLNEHKKLIEVANNVRKWQKASPGEPSVNAEAELMESLASLRGTGAFD